MEKRLKIVLIVTVIIAAGIAGAVIGTTYNGPGPYRDREFFRHDNNTSAPPRNGGMGMSGVFEQVSVLKIAITTINAVICVILLVQYASIYKKIKSDFTIALMIMTFALMLYAITSNPLLQIMFGYMGAGMGPFLTLPDIFATLALGAMLYISIE